jgi:sugar-specific transcriptional regulator TrmB/DNA-binding CsgD family transcriptional regulator
MSTLEAVGLTDLEERTYRELIRRRSATTEVVCNAAGVSPELADEVFAGLEAKGLISRSTGRERRWVAAAPDAALEALILGKRSELEKARSTVATLMREFKAAADERKADELVEIFTGRDAIRRRFEQLQHSLRDEVLSFNAMPYVVPLDDGDSGLEGLRRGVRSRAIYERPTLELPGALDHIRRFAEVGEEARSFEELPMKLFIGDRRVGLVPVNLDEPGVEPSVTVVHECALLDALIALFEQLWAQATVILADTASGSPSPSALSSEDRQLLSLLLSGLTDARIARQLGVSLRTVQRRVTVLMELAGVKTRLQLGWQAATNGWLAASDASS